MIILYTFIQEESHQYLLNKYLNTCTNDLNTKYLKYTRWQDAQLSLLGKVLLKYGLNHYFDIQDFQVIRTKYNKPFLADHNLHFNISHSKNLVVCCISKFVVGIDVEYIDYKINYRDFEPQMTKNELKTLYDSVNNEKKFFTYWTKKEAVVKALGKGLLIPLKSFEVIENRTLISNNMYYLNEVFIDKEYKCYVAIFGQDIKQKNIDLEYVAFPQL